MIIEDDKNLQEVYKKNFEAADYEVIIEGDGLSGISSVVEKMPDVILLDIMMPNMDGFGFLKAIKDNTSINIPVVMCSNLTDQETNAKALASGATAILVKTDYSGRELVQKIDALLMGKESKHKNKPEDTLV